MTLLEQERLVAHTPERLSSPTIQLFNDAEELILDIQDSPAFAQTLEKHSIAFDDTTSDYWQAVRFVTEDSIKNGHYVDNKPLVQAMRIVAATPDAAYQQYFLDNASDYGLNYETRQNCVYAMSTFNDLLRDYVESHLDTPFDSFSLLLTESASKGIDRSLIHPTALSMKATLKGIRTEVGLEQKAAAAHLSFRRGTTDEDMRGVDYIIDGIEVDVKSSLRSLSDASHDSLLDKAYFIKGKKATLFPYDYPADYKNGSFHIKESVIEDRAHQLAKDITAIKKLVA
jgi:hypothetical protein